MMEIKSIIGLVDKLGDNVDEVDLVSWLSEQFPAGMTVNRGIGYWQGVREENLTFTVAVGLTNEAIAHANYVFQSAARRVNQEAVYISVNGSVEIVEV